MIVPRHEFLDLHAALLGQRGVDLRLGLVIRPAGQGVEIVENLEHLGLILLGQQRGSLR